MYFQHYVMPQTATAPINPKNWRSSVSVRGSCLPAFLSDMYPYVPAATNLGRNFPPCQNLGLSKMVIRLSKVE
jgi:hypothetical protein